MVRMSDNAIGHDFIEHDGFEAIVRVTYEADAMKLNEDLVVTLEEKDVSLSIRYNEHEAGNFVLDRESTQRLIDWLKANGVVV
jgi:hypothetical protein